MFLSSGDDDGASVSADVDHVAEISVGVVKGVADLVTALSNDATPDISLLVSDLLLLICVLIQVDSDRDTL